MDASQMTRIWPGRKTKCDDGPSQIYAVGEIIAKRLPTGDVQLNFAIIASHFGMSNPTMEKLRDACCSGEQCRQGINRININYNYGNLFMSGA